MKNIKLTLICLTFLLTGTICAQNHVIQRPVTAFTTQDSLAIYLLGGQTELFLQMVEKQIDEKRDEESYLEKKAAE